MSIYSKITLGTAMILTLMDASEYKLLIVFLLACVLLEMLIGKEFEDDK